MARVVKLGIKRPAYRPLLPDPEPREAVYTIISVDDHLMEAPHAFEGRLPAKLEDKAPHVVETEEGHQVWVFEETPYFQVGFMCVAGRAKEDQRVEPARFEELRKGAWGAKARIHHASGRSGLSAIASVSAAPADGSPSASARNSRPAARIVAAGRLM